DRGGFHPIYIDNVPISANTNFFVVIRAVSNNSSILSYSVQKRWYSPDSDRSFVSENGTTFDKTKHWAIRSKISYEKIDHHKNGIRVGIPPEFALLENYPNPFNLTTTLRFDVPEVSNITLTIYNMLGQRVRSFNMQSTPAGYHAVTWDGTNDLGKQVSAGVYLYRIQAGEFTQTKKMLLLK
ncbi:uncharacterized protein METZ01_LOCUS374928, partial [marine metagenome]